MALVLMIVTVLFLLVVCVVLPLLAFSSYRYLRRPEASPDDTPTSGQLATQAVAIQGTVGALALATASANDLDLVWTSALRAGPIAWAIGVVAAFLVVAWLEARRPLGAGDALRKMFRAEGFTPSWFFVMSVAAVVEELAFRGVLYLLLTPIAGPVPAAIVSAWLFGASHAAQGPRAVGIGTVIALALQGLYVASGALLIPIATHLAYDLGVSWMARYLSARGSQAAGG